jgi:hypothetical protein
MTDGLHLCPRCERVWIADDLDACARCTPPLSGAVGRLVPTLTLRALDTERKAA